MVLLDRLEVTAPSAAVTSFPTAATTIKIASCYKLTDVSLAAIGETCKGLTSIDMRHNSKMTDVGMASVTVEFHCLKWVHCVIRFYFLTSWNG